MRIISTFLQGWALSKKQSQMDPANAVPPQEEKKEAVINVKVKGAVKMEFLCSYHLIICVGQQ